MSPLVFPRADQHHRLAGYMPGISGVRGIAEDVSRLYKNVNIVLKDVRDAEVPHWELEEVLVEALEVADYIFNHAPCLFFRSRVGFAVQQTVLGVNDISVERRK
jgi:hypothetical protein